jgi:predicted SAM-dependent methyltransferase
MNRVNIGCGSIRPEGWTNVDVELWDVRQPPPDAYRDAFSSAVCSFAIQELDFHELPVALQNIKAVLKPWGVLRVLVPDIAKARRAYHRGDRAWFPQDERTGSIDAAYCTYLTWFGTVKSVFTPIYLRELLDGAGFVGVHAMPYGWTDSDDPTIVELDSRRKEALIFEARRPR